MAILGTLEARNKSVSMVRVGIYVAAVIHCAVRKQVL